MVKKDKDEKILEILNKLNNDIWLWTLETEVFDPDKRTTSTTRQPELAVQFQLEPNGFILFDANTQIGIYTTLLPFLDEYKEWMAVDYFVDSNETIHLIVEMMRDNETYLTYTHSFRPIENFKPKKRPRP